MFLSQRRKLIVQNQMSHKYGELCALQGERYHLLTCVEPVKASEWHAEVSRHMLKKMDALERMKLGRAPPPPSVGVPAPPPNFD